MRFRRALVACMLLGLVGSGAPVGTAAAEAGRQDAPASGRASIEFEVQPRSEPAVGELVTWDYIIHNHTSYALTKVVVTDEVEGQVCFVDTVAGSTSKTCSVVAVAGPRSFVAQAKVTGTSVTADGDVIRTVEAIVERSYTVKDASTAPEDLAFTETPDLPDGTSPSWPVDRWARWVVVACLAAGIAGAAFRLQPEPEPTRSTRSSSRS